MKRVRLSHLLATVAGACGLLGLGCGSTDETVAVVSKPEAGPTITVGMPCNTSSDCGFVDGGGEFFCGKSACDVAGTCQPRPTTCSNDFNPVLCGCATHLFYQNTCLANLHGDTAGTCQANPCTATDAGACTEGSHCALVEQGCKPPTDGRPLVGICEVVPDQCSAPVTTVNGVVVPLSFQVVDCKMNACTDYCSAVKNGAPISFSTQPCSPQGP